MTVTQKDSLKETILGILRESGKPLILNDFESRLKGQFDSTFEVREAVWELVNEQKAAFTPDWHVISRN